ncbi:MAG: YhjD/YihY/BrkB family envelope integrity protein [Phycisphaerales bacterium]
MSNPAHSMNQEPHTSPDPGATPETAVSRWREEFHRLLAVAKLGIKGLYRSQIPRMAAAMSYRTIFSIIPVMAISLLIFGSFVSDEEVDSGVRRVLDYAGISQISPTPSQADPAIDDSLPDPTDQTSLPDSDSASDPEPEVNAAQEQAENEQATPQNNLGNIEELISNLISRVNTSIRNVPAGWIAMASLLVLIYAAMSMLIEIEKSFNQLCAAPSGRPWLRRLMLYWTMLTLGTLLLAATFIVGDGLAKWILSVSSDGGTGRVVGATLASFGVSVLISTVLMLSAYLTIPNTKIKIRPALAGAFMAAILWELGKAGFTMYLRNATGYTKFYGSLAILPLFLLWVYVTWVIVLLGMQATHGLQHFTRLVNAGLAALSGEDEGDRPVLLDPLVLVSAGAFIGKRFEIGDSTTPDQLASGLDIDSSLSAKLMAALRKAGLLNLIAQGEDADDAFTLARPSDQIKLVELLDAGSSLDMLRDQSRANIPSSILGAARDSMGEQTLSELLKAN